MTIEVVIRWLEEGGGRDSDRTGASERGGGCKRLRGRAVVVGVYNVLPRVVEPHTKFKKISRRTIQYRLGILFRAHQVVVVDQDIRLRVGFLFRLKKKKNLHIAFHIIFSSTPASRTHVIGRGFRPYVFESPSSAALTGVVRNRLLIHRP